MFISEEGVEEGNVWSNDQSQFQHEVSSASTLSYRGVKTTGNVLESVNSSTHICTIDVITSVLGENLTK